MWSQRCTLWPAYLMQDTGRANTPVHELGWPKKNGPLRVMRCAVQWLLLTNGHCIGCFLCFGRCLPPMSVPLMLLQNFNENVCKGFPSFVKSTMVPTGVLVLMCICSNTLPC